jgi:hypothetical protein
LDIAPPDFAAGAEDYEMHLIATRDISKGEGILVNYGVSALNLSIFLVQSTFRL